MATTAAAAAGVAPALEVVLPLVVAAGQVPPVAHDSPPGPSAAQSLALKHKALAMHSMALHDSKHQGPTNWRSAAEVLKKTRCMPAAVVAAGVP